MDQNNTNSNTNSVDSSDLEARVAELEKEKSLLQERCNELENNWKRAVADYRNYEKRVTEEKGQLIALSNFFLIQDILPILDNLETLQNHIDDTGLKMIVKEFIQKLTDTGVQEIETNGKEFDHNTMEAVDTIEGEKNKVIEVLNKGYFLNGKLLRPVKVKVGNGLSKEDK